MRPRCWCPLARLDLKQARAIDRAVSSGPVVVTPWRGLVLPGSVRAARGARQRGHGDRRRISVGGDQCLCRRSGLCSSSGRHGSDRRGAGRRWQTVRRDPHLRLRTPLRSACPRSPRPGSASGERQRQHRSVGARVDRRRRGETELGSQRSALREHPRCREPGPRHDLRDLPTRPGRNRPRPRADASPDRLRRPHRCRFGRP